MGIKSSAATAYSVAKIKSRCSRNAKLALRTKSLEGKIKMLLRGFQPRILQLLGDPVVEGLHRSSDFIVSPLSKSPLGVSQNLCYGGGSSPKHATGLI